MCIQKTEVWKGIKKTQNHYLRGEIWTYQFTYESFFNLIVKTHICTHTHSIFIDRVYVNIHYSSVMVKK